MPDKNILSAFDYFEALYKNAKENTVILMETDGTIAAVNKAFTNCFGYEEKDIVGKNSQILFTEEEREKELPKHELDQVQRRGQSSDNNYLVNKNKQVTWVSGESVLVENEDGKKMVLKVLQNIHQQKTGENSIRQLNTFNENILRSIKDAVFVLDEDLNILMTNPSFKALLSKRREEKVDIAEFLKRTDGEENLYNDLKKAVKERAGFAKKKAEIRMEGGSKRIFEIECTPMENSKEMRLLVVMHDITIYKELEREREDIIGFITHELRNPLSNLMLSNDLMKEAANGNEISFLKELLDRSENNIHRMNKMITGLYEATKVHSGYFALDLSEFNFGGMVKEAIETIQVLHPSFKIEKEGESDFTIVADRYRLIQVITNFLSNAIKYSADKKEVNLLISHDSKSVTVTVQDYGVGIPKDHLPYVFERFFRTEKTRKIEGIGLGLYLCRQIVRSHHGNVGVESTEDKGSEFYFTIPINVSESNN